MSMKESIADDVICDYTNIEKLSRILGISL